METIIRILIADDHPIMRQGLRDLIRSEPGLELVGEASNGYEMLQRAQELNPDVYIIDLVMPGKSGIETIVELRAANPKARILILSSFSDKEEIRKAIQAGALGYILKIAHPKELIRAIWKVSMNEPAFSDTLALDLFYKDTQVDLGPGGQLLTKRELTLLKLLGRGLTNKEIAEKMFIGENSVKVYVSRLLKKLNLENRTQAALYAVRLNLERLPGE
jgi:two-component system, NarL family, response regulator DevR